MVTNRLLFRLKKPNNYVKENMPVYIRITIDSVRTELSVNRDFDPDRWNKKAERAAGNKEDAKTLNAYLETLRVKIHEIHRELLAANEIVTVERLKNRLVGKTEERPRMLLEIFSDHNEQMNKLIENN